MINLKSYIKKHPKLYYLALCVYKCNDKKFRKFCLDYKENPRIIHFEYLGNENPDKNIYLIRVGNSAVGMFSLCIWTLRFLEFADRFHLTPIISWSEKVAYFRKGGVNGIYDPYEYYFKQPAGLSIDGITKSYNIAVNRQQDRAYGNVADSYDFSVNEINRLSVIWNKYIKLQTNIEQDINERITKLFNGEKIIGVHVRGADWRKMKISGHPITASEEEYIKVVEKVRKKYGYSKVFLATDSEDTIEKFRNAFGNKLLYFSEIKRTSVNSSSLVIFDESNDPYQLGFEILLDAFALAKCEAFIAGVSYVSYGVQIIKKSNKEEFQYLKIIDRGLQKKSHTDFKKAADQQRKALKSERT